jgi:hypothetical protein
MRKRFMLFTLLLLVPACGERSQPRGKQAEHKLPAFTAANFDKEVLLSSMPVLVDFWGEG